MSQGCSSTPAVREIPGFYYDEDAKKYFRITKDHPGPKKKLKKADINRDVVLKEPLTSRLAILQRREIQTMSTQSFRRSLKKSSIQGLKLRNETDLKLSLEDANLTNSASIKSIVPSARQDILAIVSKIKGSDKSILQIYDTQFSKQRKFEIVGAYDILIGQISDVIFSPYENDITNELLISSVNERLNLSQAAVFWVDDFLVTDRVIKVNKNQYIWSSCFVRHSSVNTRIALDITCAFSWEENPLAASLSNGILMVGDENRSERHPFVKTSRSDVLALSCSKLTCTLYAGSRDGFIRCCDCRRMGIVGTAKAKKSIDDLKMLRNEVHLLVSTMAGHLELWDVRTWKPVLSYNGHMNTHSLLSIETDANEDFLAVVGEDCIARIWDLKTAGCLKELPVIRFNGAGEPTRPSVAFLDQVARSSICSGFLYGVEDELYYYDL